MQSKLTTDHQLTRYRFNFLSYRVFGVSMRAAVPSRCDHWSCTFEAFLKKIKNTIKLTKLSNVYNI